MRRVPVYVWVVGVLVALISLLFWLWVVLSGYIDPHNPTQRKDLVQAFALIVAGVVGLVGAVVGLVGLYFSRKTLQHNQAALLAGQQNTQDTLQQQQQNTRDTLRQQRELEDRRAQETAMQTYLEHMTQLVREGLREDEPLSSLRLLTRGRTLSLFWQLDPKRKRALLQILHEAGLIITGTSVIGLSGADLREAYLRELTLRDADLSGADMKGANLVRADLSGTDLRGADLDGADMSGADLHSANLERAKGVTDGQLEEQARSLIRATMPSGRRYGQ